MVKRMEEFDLGDKITFDNKEFLIIEKVIYNEKTYLHLLDMESKNAEIFEMKIEDNDIKVRLEDNEEIKAEILMEILEKNEDIEV